MMVISRSICISLLIVYMENFCMLIGKENANRSLMISSAVFSTNTNHICTSTYIPTTKDDSNTLWCKEILKGTIDYSHLASFLRAVRRKSLISWICLGYKKKKKRDHRDVTKLPKLPVRASYMEYA